MSIPEKARNLGNLPSTPCSEKPKHVKRLDFGTSILDLKITKSPSSKGIVVDGNISKIPSTRKQDFVRQWIETHNENIPNLSNDVSSSQSSPILGSSTGKRVRRSPLIGNSKKRVKVKSNFNSSIIDEPEHSRLTNIMLNDMKQNVDSSRSGKNYSKDNKNDDKNNTTRKDSGKDIITTTAKLCTDSESCIGAESPILDRHSYFYKRRRRKMHAKKSRRLLAECGNTMDKKSQEECIKRIDEFVEGLTKKCTKKPDAECIDKNMNVNSAILKNHFSGYICTEEKSNIVTPQKSVSASKLSPKNVCDKKDKNRSNSSSRSSGLFTSFQSSESETKFNIMESPTCSKNGSSIKIDSSDDNERTSHKIREKITSNSTDSDSDKTISDIIDDVDTQDILKTIRNCNPDKSVSGKTRNSNDIICPKSTTFVSQLTNTQSSEKISQLTSSSKEGVCSRKTDLTISAYSSPPRCSPCPTMMVEMLDSAKKRRKPKKGSMVERLHTLINGKVSNIRIWRHQMKRLTFNNDSIQSVTVRLQNLASYVGRQFLEGIIIEDRFELLKDYRGRGKFKVIGSGSSNDVYKGITIMTVPEIVGKIEMKSECILKIYPPWETLDKHESILNITYFNVTSSEEYLEIMKNTKVVRLDEEVLVEEYDCPCFAAEKKISSCKEHTRKPDLIEAIFES